jgi:hypothetical protein
MLYLFRESDFDGPPLKRILILSKIDWTAENVAILLACTTDAELANAFPTATLETLKRKARSVRASDETLDDKTDSDTPALSLTGDSGVIKTGTVAEPITDWTDTLELWGLDPEVFEVLQPVTMKAWGRPGEFRYSYAARIQKRVTAEPDVEETVDIAGWRETLKTFVDFPSRRVGGAAAYAIMVADPQLGKPGTQEAVANWTNGIDGHVNRIRNIIDSGVDVSDIALIFMGDEHEGAVGNYASQPYEVEINYSDQITLDFDMRAWSIRQLLGLGLPIQIGSVPSNHGEHTRFGSNKALTSIYDNSSTMVASLVKKVFDGTAISDQLTWQIATDRQDVNLTLGGVKANFTHGHISHGSGSKTGGISSKAAIEKQILGRREEIGDTSLFFSAHYHHFNVIEDRGRTFFGCPALEAEKSSRWFYDGSGVWSRPGMLGLLVGTACGDRGWDELSVI